jgi:hypothetical protein
MATEGSATYTLYDDADALASAFRHVDVEFRCQDRGPFRGRLGFTALQGTEVQHLVLSQTSVSHAFTGRFGSPAPDDTPVASARQLAWLLVQAPENLEEGEAAEGATLTLPYSNAQAEGQIHKLKLIKPQMYGRANFDLLRHRVLLAA